MNDALRLIVSGFAHIGRVTPRFAPLSTAPFADAKRSLVKQAEPLLNSLKQRIERHGKTESRAAR